MRFADAPYSERSRYGYGRSARGVVLALIAEGLLILLVLTLGSAVAYREIQDAAVTEVRFKAVAEQQRPSATPEEETPEVAKAEPPPPPAKPEKVTPPRPQPQPKQPPRLIKLPPKQVAAADITPAPKPPAQAAVANRPAMGPPDTSPAQRDSQRVGGSGPNGEPLYAAAWYREPYEDELSGYLSTATGPGWGLIACRTAPDYRVEDCVQVDEYPTGSNIARSVLAAAWQFKVRPPRVGGKPKVGEWVRIRITYGMKERPQQP
jgi:periplasmic protein TonB